MEHLSCFAGGLFAVAAHVNVNVNLSIQYMTLAKEVTKTCHELYYFTTTSSIQSKKL